MTLGANDVQVGGDHYKSDIQHWDLVALLGLDYFQGQITKYVTRHRKKNGRQDLEKALHYASKLRELLRAGAWQPSHLYCERDLLQRYVQANGLSALDAAIVWLTCRYVTDTDIGWLIIELKALVQDAYPEGEE